MNPSIPNSVLLSVFIALGAGSSSAANWPGWRGPKGDGVSLEKDLPVQWTDKDNVRWRVELPGPGNSSPIVWGDRVFVSQAVNAENRRTLMCLDLATGKLLWQSGVTYTDKEQTQENNPYCAGTPATDGERVYVSLGSPGVYAYDFAGKEVWHRDLGPLNHMFGTAVSPVVHGDLVIVNHGPTEKSRLVALNRKTGEIVWEVEPPKPDPEELQQAGPGGRGRGGPGGPGGPGAGPGGSPGGPGGPGGGPGRGRGGGGGAGGSWSTPIVVSAGGHDELVVGFPYRLVGLDPKTGKQLWFSKGLGGSIYTTPLSAGERVVASSGGIGGGSAIAVKPGGSGDVTETQRLWRLERVKSAFGSGVVHEGHLYTISQEGIVECSELATGKSLWQERLTGPGAQTGTWSSMLLAEGRIYVPNKSGDVFVLRAVPKFEVASTNSVGEPTNASLAAANQSLLLRTSKALWCLGRPAR